MSASIAEDGHARHRDKTEICDLCGAEADGSSELCVFITCSRHVNEDDSMYHQNCLEKYLKKHGFQYNRKTGFPCPRGRGKGTKFSEECKGKVDKSHPVIPKNEEKKKKAAAPPLAEVMAKQPKKGPEPKEKKPALAAGGGGRKNNPAKSFIALASSSSTAYKPPAPRPPVVPRVNAWQNGAAQQAVRAAPPANLFAAPDPPAAAAADAAEEESPRLPVGLVLMDEAVSRAQKKNLQRRKKKQAAMDAISEAPTDASVDQASSLDDWPAEQQAAGAAAAAGGDGAGAGPSSGSASTAALLNGSHFVTDIRRYQQLLGMTFEDSSDEEDDGADGESGDYIPSDDAASALTASVPGSPPACAVAAASPPSPVPAATATVFQGQGNATAAAAVSDEDAALQAAIEASERQYRLEQEQDQQRAILAGAPAGMYGSYATDAGFRQDQQPAPQVQVPVVTPVTPAPLAVVPVAVPAPVATPKLLAQVPAAAPVYNVAAHGGSHAFNFARPQPQPQQATAQFGGGGYQCPVWQQAQVPQQQKFAGYGSDNGGYGGGYGAGNTGVGGYGAAPAAYGGGAPAMVAAGHGLAPAPGGDDDDDLSSLLELCGVAG